jgi:hypothetical protein
MKWEDYILDKAMLKDVKEMTDEQLATKYAKLSVQESNPSSLRSFLIMDTFKLLNEPRCYGLDETQQDEACRLVRFLEKVSQAIDAPEMEKARRGGRSFDLPNDRYATPNVTIADYIKRVQERIRKANA